MHLGKKNGRLPLRCVPWRKLNVVGVLHAVPYMIVVRNSSRLSLQLIVQVSNNILLMVPIYLKPSKIILNDYKAPDPKGHLTNETEITVEIVGPSQTGERTRHLINKVNY